MSTPRTPELPPLTSALAGPLLLLVWGMAAGVLLWGSGVDVAIQVWLQDNYVQGFNSAMRIMGSLGKGSLQVGICVFVAAVWAYHEWRAKHLTRRCARVILMTVPVFALAGIINWVLKWSIGRGRPKEFLWNGASPYALNPFEGTAQWWSFPSGHTCSTFAIAVWIGFVFPSLRIPFLMVATVLSFSRFLALTPHYFGDVVAGATVGSTVAWVIWILMMRHKQLRSICKMNRVENV